MAVIKKNQKFKLKWNGLLDWEILLTENENICRQKACWRFSVIPVHSKKKHWFPTWCDNFYGITCQNEPVKWVTITRWLNLKSYLVPQAKNMLTNGDFWRASVEMLLLLGKKVVFLQQEGEIDAGTRKIESLVDWVGNLGWFCKTCNWQ